MCDFVEKRLALIRKYKDVIAMFSGFLIAIPVYMDFRTVVKAQAETSSQTVEILRTMDTRLSILEHQSIK